MIPALVLTAGLATRLRPLSLLRAKAATTSGEAQVALDGADLAGLELERRTRQFAVGDGGRGTRRRGPA